MRREFFLLLLFALLSVLLFACGGRDRTHEQDGPPDRELDPDDVVVLKPRPEPRARYGNHSPYTVLGKTYRVMDSAVGYRETGIASWYGKKFHGRNTSSGEKYDMYVATAAHKSLPLPTYVEVRNLDNGRKLVVKVNDRGPFHDERIIDLSYGAAVLLGVTRSGTARVELKAITFDKQKTHGGKAAHVLFQVGAFTEKSRARGVVGRLEAAGLKKVHIKKGRSQGKKVWRVRVGPLKDSEQAWRYEQKIIELGYARPHRIESR